MRPRASAHSAGISAAGWRSFVYSPWGKAAAIALIGLLLLGGYVAYTLRDLPDPGKQDVLAHTIVVYDRKGREIEQRNAQGQYHVVLTLAEMGKQNRDATLAAEDRNFYNHGAIDYMSTGRAVLADLTSHSYSQGGSTITQQLVKIQLLTPQKSIFRKAQEAILAEGLESRYSKDQILEMYMNRVYYGHNAYGIGAAAKIYFGKQPKELTPAQAAFLAGLIQAPIAYDPQNHFDLARERQLYVLHGMITTHALTADQEKQAEQEPISKELVYTPVFRDSKAPHFVDYVIGRLEQQYGNAAVQQGGIRIYTTLDLDVQAAADDAVKRGVKALGGTGVNNGDLLAVKPDTGEVLAWVGSADYYNDSIGGQYDVITAPRSPGSSFKAYTYETAFKNRKFMPGTFVHDKPTKYGDYQPMDFDNSYMGTLTLRKALLLSRNIPAVEVADKTGEDQINAFAKSAGINTDLNPGLSTAIGGSDVTMFDHVEGYATFANQGTKEPLMTITKVVDSQGNDLIQNTPGQQEGKTQVMTPQEAYLLTDILKHYPDQWHFPWPHSLNLAAKTGTSGAKGVTRDSWIMAYNGSLVAGAWVGNTGPNGQGGDITTYGEQVADTTMSYFLNSPALASYNKGIERPSGLSDVKACDGSPDIALPDATQLSCSGGPSPSPSPTATPSPAPTLPPPPTLPPTQPPTQPPVPLPSPTPKATP